MKIYFSRPIAGGTELEGMYSAIADVLELQGHTFTNPFVVRPKLWNNILPPKDIYARDIKALSEADIFVWECTMPSNGCGIEAAYAKAHNIPVVALYWQRGVKSLSAMIEGDPYNFVIKYTTIGGLDQMLAHTLDQFRKIKPNIKNISSTSGTPLEQIASELKRARELHKTNIFSIAEAYTVILEEVDEFWDEVRKKPENRNIENMRKELIQVAAMCVRAIEDCNL